MILTGIARENLVEKNLICENTIKIDYKANCIPDVYGNRIGRKFLNTGEVDSYWMKDMENGNTDELEKIIRNAKVYEKRRHLADCKKIDDQIDVIDYYILYDIAESSKNKPTVVENYVVGSVNGNWECEYELLLTCGEGITRRIVICKHTANIGMIDWISGLEEELRKVPFDDKGTAFEGLFTRDEDGEFFIVMYNEIGEPRNVDIENITNFMNMIVSVRCIKCAFVETKS